jgi:queuine tRNA-ribosyltransferase
MLLTPESSVAAQKQLGADIIIPLDELPPYHTSPDVLAASLARSHRWMARSLATHLADVRQQAMYAVVHGGMSLELRQQVRAQVVVDRRRGRMPGSVWQRLRL